MSLERKNLPTLSTTLVIVAALMIAPLGYAAGTCHHAYLAEGQPEPAIFGMSTTDAGFTSYFWAWGGNPSDQGTENAGLVDDAGGIAVNPGILWANVDSCSGLIDGTALLVESQSTENGGIYALAMLAGADAQIDALQGSTGQSIAEAIPTPSSSFAGSGSDAFGLYADFSLSWNAPSGNAWALSDPVAVHAGFALYFRTGSPVSNGDKAAFSLVGITPGSAPYILDDSDAPDGLLPDSQLSCLVRVRPAANHYFALSLIFDGSGATTGDPQADPSAVETTYVSDCSHAVTSDIDIFADGFESGDTSAWAVSVP
jgi:hypothetical protein